jgi:hypothetical protein
MKPVRPKKRWSSGQSLAEFALCLPVFLLMVFAVIQLALIAQAAFFTHYAAHCAARAYAVFIQQDQDSALAKAKDAAALGLAFVRPSMSYELELLPARQTSPSTEISGLNKQIFEMRLTTWCPLILPFVKFAFQNGLAHRGELPLKATIVMQSENNEDFRRAQENKKDDE